MRFWKIVVMVAETCGVTDASSTQIDVMGEGAWGDSTAVKGGCCSPKRT